MSRTSLISNCRTRAVWDRPATGTRLLPWPKPVPVSLGCPINPLRMTPKTSAPSRPTCPPRPRAADARAHSPRMITHGSYPQRACPTTVDARALSRMNSRPAFIGVEADACGIAPRMPSRLASLGVEADACGIAPRMNPRSASFGVEADACGIAPWMTSRAPTLRAAARAAEGALATLILTPSQSLPTVYVVIPDSDRAESAPWRESIPRGGAAHPVRKVYPEQSRREGSSGGVAHVCQSVAHPPPPTTKGAA